MSRQGKKGIDFQAQPLECGNIKSRLKPALKASGFRPRHPVRNRKRLATGITDDDHPATLPYSPPLHRYLRACQRMKPVMNRHSLGVKTGSMG